MGNELIESYKQFIELSSADDVELLIVGEFEDFDPISETTREEMLTNKSIVMVDWCEDVQKYFSVADVFLFPTHREGFGNVAIEASAMGLPIIAFDVVGCRESVVDRSTGYLCEPFSTEIFAQKMFELYENPRLRADLGQRGIKRVRDEFDSRVVWARLEELYREISIGD